jgi:hypothetical protein
MITIRPCLSNVDAEADSAAARAKAPESRSWRVVPGVFGLAGASVAAPAGGISVDQGRRSPCVCAAGRGGGAHINTTNGLILIVAIQN